MAFAASCLLLFASRAPAAAPGNDDFANREVLSGSLPIEVSRSNVEATKEEGEFLALFSPAGHSVWFEWEASEDGWVTVGACDSDFNSVEGVYTGTAVNALTRIATGNAAEGPHCPYRQREYTFYAENGAKYEIVADGNSFHLPESPPPDTEGDFTLRIEATLPPVNDDFANATPIVSQLEEEFEGEAFYRGVEFGYNWNATEESGEPELIGGPSGASVWYSWTAPASGMAKFSPSCCGASDLRLGIYTGDSLEDLQLRAGGIGSGGSWGQSVKVGDTFRLVVYGLTDETSGDTSVGSFQIAVSLMAQVSVPAPEEGEESSGPSIQVDTTPPQTKIATRVLKRRPPIWIFRFHSSEPGSTFRCRLDKRPFKVCPFAQRYGRLRPGRHTLRAFAVDAAGNADPSPAIVRFRVPKRPKHRHRAKSARLAPT